MATRSVEAFVYPEAIDVTTCSRLRDKLREELTLAKVDHAAAVEELDEEAMLPFRRTHLAVRVRPVNPFVAG